MTAIVISAPAQNGIDGHFLWQPTLESLDRILETAKFLHGKTDAIQIRSFSREELRLCGYMWRMPSWLASLPETEASQNFSDHQSQSGLVELTQHGDDTMVFRANNGAFLSPPLTVKHIERIRAYVQRATPPGQHLVIDLSGIKQSPFWYFVLKLDKAWLEKLGRMFEVNREFPEFGEEALQLTLYVSTEWGGVVTSSELLVLSQKMKAGGLWDVAIINLLRGCVDSNLYTSRLRLSPLGGHPSLRLELLQENTLAWRSSWLFLAEIQEVMQQRQEQLPKLPAVDFTENEA